MLKVKGGGERGGDLDRVRRIRANAARSRDRGSTPKRVDPALGGQGQRGIEDAGSTSELVERRWRGATDGLRLGHDGCPRDLADEAVFGVRDL